DQRTGTVTFHRDAWFGAERSKDAVDEEVIFGVVLASETDEWFDSDFLQGNGFQSSERMSSSHRYAQRVGAQQFKLDTCGLLAKGLEHDRDIQRGVLQSGDEFIA